MKTAAIALAISTMLTIEQKDAYRTHLDDASSAVSADGRFVAFATYSQIVPADTNANSDVYVLDRASHHVSLESADTGRYSGDSRHPGISGNGRFVVFERADVIVMRDRQEGVTRAIGAGHEPAITEDGRAVLFSAGSAESVAAGDANGAHSDVYATDLRTSRTTLISVGMPGLNPSLAASAQPAASSDGRFVAFASRLHAGSRPGAPEVFVRDTRLGATRRIAAGWDPSLDAHGQVLAFVAPSNGLQHVFLADLQTGTSRIITRSARGGLANGSSAKPKVSSDGRFVAFQSEASDLVAGEDVNLLWDVFVFDRTTATIARISGDDAEAWMEPSGGPSIDGRGSVVAFSSRHPTGASDKRNDFDLYVKTIPVAVSSRQ